MELSMSYWLEKLPPEQRLWLRRRFYRLSRPAWLGTLRRVVPLSDNYGYERGTPVDRYYIEHFLEDHRQDIHGHVLEVKDSTYTNRYGNHVEQRSVIDINPANPQATIICDLSTGEALPANTFDCFVLTQTLQFIYNVRAAIEQSFCTLRPGGVLLVTVPSVSRAMPREGVKHDYWRFTAASCQMLFEDVFGAQQVEVYSYGNVLTGVAFLMGMAYEELSCQELEAQDEYFPVIVAVRAVKR